MKITMAEYVKSINTLEQLPNENIPHIAFAGRSNVGKSSLMNTLLNRKKLVKVSSTPGKTRSINFFLINQAFYFVDLPGYGYAKVSKTMYRDWQKLMESYLSSVGQLKAVVHLFDLRHPITQMDKEFLAWLNYYDIDSILVGTKADKLSKNKLAAQIDSNLRVLDDEFGSNTSVIAFSSVTGKGKDELWSLILEHLKTTKK